MTYKYNPFWQQRIRETVRHALNVHSSRQLISIAIHLNALYNISLTI